MRDAPLQSIYEPGFGPAFRTESKRKRSAW